MSIYSNNNNISIVVRQFVSSSALSDYDHTKAQILLFTISHFPAHYHHRGFHVISLYDDYDYHD